MDDFEFDPRKGRTIAAKHGVDFAVAVRIWEGFVFEREDGRRNDGEQRLLALGTIEGRVVFVVYTWRGSKRRLISARKANRDEQEIYRAALAQSAANKKD